MNIVQTFSQFDSNCIIICEPIKNTVIENSKFLRLIYSTPQISVNGLFFHISVKDAIIEKYFDKFKCNFKYCNNTWIDFVEYIEKIILSKVLTRKVKRYKITEQMKAGYIKLFTPQEEKSKKSLTFILKISGIWENINELGLTYKFISMNTHYNKPMALTD